MRQSTRLILNATLNVGGGLINMAVGLAVVPLVISAIGREEYGVFALVSGITLYTPFIHMGMIAAVGRYSAYHMEHGDFDKVNEVVNTGVVYYRASAVVFVALVSWFAFYGIEQFVQNPELHHVARICVLVLGAAEGLVLCVGPVAGVLWALERFDLLSMTVSAFRLVRLAALAILLPFFESESGLIVVTVVMTATNLFPVVVYRFQASRNAPLLRYDMRLARWSQVRPLIGFGAGSTLWRASQATLDYLPLLLIGRYLSTAEVADFEVASRIFLMANMLVNSVVGVISPAATRLSAAGRKSELTELFLRSSKYAAGISFATCGAIGLLASLILTLWVGDQFHQAAAVASFLALGRALFFVTTSSFFVLVGMAKQHVPALVAAISVGLMFGGQVAVLEGGGGIAEVAAVSMVVLVVGWGLVVPVYACRVLGVELRAFYSVAWLRPAVAMVPACGFWYALRWAPPEYGWLTLAAAVAGGGVWVGLGWWFILFDDWDRDLVRGKLSTVAQKLRDRSSARRG